MLLSLFPYFLACISIPTSFNFLITSYISSSPYSNQFLFSFEILILQVYTCVCLQTLTHFLPKVSASKPHTGAPIRTPANTTYSNCICVCKMDILMCTNHHSYTVMNKLTLQINKYNGICCARECCIRMYVCAYMLDSIGYHGDQGFFNILKIPFTLHSR